MVEGEPGAIALKTLAFVAGVWAASLSLAACGGPRTPAPPELGEFREAAQAYNASAKNFSTPTTERQAAADRLEQAGQALRDYAQRLCGEKKAKELEDFRKDLRELDRDLGPREMTSFNGSAYVETTGRAKMLVKLAADLIAQCRWQLRGG